MWDILRIVIYRAHMVLFWMSRDTMNFIIEQKLLQLVDWCVNSNYGRLVSCLQMTRDLFVDFWMHILNDAI